MNCTDLNWNRIVPECCEYGRQQSAFGTIGKDWGAILVSSGASRKNFSTLEWESLAIQGNVDWIKERHREGYKFIDVGGDKSTNRSSFYFIEKITLDEIGAKVYKGAPSAVSEARKNAKPSNRPPSKVLCPL